MSIDNSSIEDWNVYRKLVVDTLRRLDEKTADLHDEQNVQGNKIIVLDGTVNKINEAITNLNAKVGSLSDKLNDIKTERSTEKAVQRVWLLIGGGLWTVITIGLSVWAKTLFS